MSPVEAWSEAEIYALPVTVDLPTAARAFGIGKNRSYRLAATGELPFPVLRLGNQLRVTRASLLQAVGLPPSPPNPLADPAPAQVTDAAVDMPCAAHLRAV